MVISQYLTGFIIFLPQTTDTIKKSGASKDDYVLIDYFRNSRSDKISYQVFPFFRREVASLFRCEEAKVHDQVWRVLAEFRSRIETGGIPRTLRGDLCYEFMLLYRRMTEQSGTTDEPEQVSYLSKKLIVNGIRTGDRRISNSVERTFKSPALAIISSHQLDGVATDEEIWLEAYGKLLKLKEKQITGMVFGYFKGILKNTIIDELRKKGRKRKIDFTKLPAQERISNKTTNLSGNDENTFFDYTIEKYELYRKFGTEIKEDILNGILNLLGKKEDCIDLLRRFYVLGQTKAEIMKEDGDSDSNFRQRLKRCRDRLERIVTDKLRS